MIGDIPLKFLKMCVYKTRAVIARERLIMALLFDSLIYNVPHFLVPKYLHKKDPKYLLGNIDNINHSDDEYHDKADIANGGHGASIIV